MTSSAMEPKQRAKAAGPKRLAATLLLLRDGEQGLEVLMTRRRAEMYYGDAWVFPGGTVDDDDQTPAALACVPAEVRARCVRRIAMPCAPALPEAGAIGLYVAACRETFEETGLLLARNADGTACSEVQLARIRARRDEIAARNGAFTELLNEECLTLELDRFVYWTHWITPVTAPKLFDVHFFATELVAGQELMTEQRESTAIAWIRPNQMIEAYRSGSASLMPPTLLTLMDLADCEERHGSAASVLAAESNRIVLPILPKLQWSDTEVLAVYPWDPEYAAMPGEGIDIVEKVPQQLRKLPSRYTMRLQKQTKDE